jgi:hypothetical protein
MLRPIKFGPHLSQPDELYDGDTFRIEAPEGTGPLLIKVELSSEKYKYHLLVSVDRPLTHILKILEWNHYPIRDYWLKVHGDSATDENIHEGDRITIEWSQRGGALFAEFYKTFFPEDQCPEEANGINDILRLIQKWTPQDYEEWSKNF